MHVRAASLILAALLVHAPALAETSNEAKQAAALYERALKAIDEGQKEEAAGLMRSAFFIHPSSEYVCDLGRLELSLGHGAKACNALTVCLRMLPAVGAEESVHAGKSLLDSAKALAGTMKVSANIPLADVFIGGVLYGKTPLLGPAYVDPGRHMVELRAPGYDSATRVVDVEAGKELDLHFDMKPTTLRASPPPPPLSTAKKPAPPPPQAKQRKEAHPRKAVLVAGYGMSLVGTAVGVGGLMAANAAVSEGELIFKALAGSDGSTCTIQSTDQPCRDAGGGYGGVVGFTALGVGGIALALAGGGVLAYEFLRTEEANKEHVCAVLTPAAGGGMFLISGAW